MAMDSAHRCDRARAWASLRLDNELSQLESALLDAHLRDCASCCAFAEQIEASTAAIRGAGLAALPHPVLVPVRRRSARRGLVGSVAAAAMLAATAAGAFFGVHQLGSHQTGFRPTAMIASGNESENVLRSLRRQQLIAQSRPLPRNKSFL
jgi:ferric-dicitrate binding protein FerR (iron transport regulator)